MPCHGSLALLDIWRSDHECTNEYLSINELLIDKFDAYWISVLSFFPPRRGYYVLFLMIHNLQDGGSINDQLIRPAFASSRIFSSPFSNLQHGGLLWSIDPAF